MITDCLTYDELNISLTDVFDTLQCPDTDASLRVEVNEIIKQARDILQARFTILFRDSIDGFDVGKIIHRQLAGAERYAFFIATAGCEYQTFQDRLKESGDIVRMFIADALGSVIAEACADRMEKRLATELAGSGLLSTNRFSPGYCGWHVSQQQILFPLFKGETCGVQLTPSSLMIPIKSVSGIIGIGTKVMRHDYPCGLCELKTCYKRRLPHHSHPSSS